MAVAGGHSPHQSPHLSNFLYFGQKVRGQLDVAVGAVEFEDPILRGGAGGANKNYRQGKAERPALFQSVCTPWLGWPGHELPPAYIPALILQWLNRPEDGRIRISKRGLP